MAEEKEVIVFEIDVSSYEKALKTQSDSIALLTQKQKELRKAATEGNDAAAVELERVNAQLKVQQQEYRTTQAVLVGYTAQTKKATDTINLENNSIQQNRDLLKQLTAQVITTAKPQQELIDRVKATSDTLKKQEAALGDTRRNVGNYAGSIVDAVKQISVSGTNLGAIIDPIKNITGGFKNAGGGAAGLTAALKGGLLAAVPAIGAGLSVLIDYFQQLGGVADKAEQIFAGVSGGFSAFVNGGSAIEAGQQIAQLTAELQDLEDASARSVLTNALVEQDIKRLGLLARDRTRSEAERIQLLDIANEKALTNFNEERDRITKIALAEEKAFALKNNLSELEVNTAIFNNATLKKRYDFLTDSQIEKTRERVGAIVKLDGDEVKKLISNRVQLAAANDRYTEIVDKNTLRSNKLREEIEKEKEKSDEKEKARLEKLAKDREQYLANLNKLENEFLLNDRQRLEKSFEDKLATIKGESQREVDLRFAIEQDKETALEKFDADAQAKIEAREKERAAKALEERRKELTELLQLSGQQLENELERIDQSIAGEQFKADQKKAITLKYLNDQLLLAQQLAEVDNVLTDTEIANLEKLRLQIEKVQKQTTSPDAKPVTLGDSLGVSKEQVADIQLGLEAASQGIELVSSLVNETYKQRQTEIEATKNDEIAAIEASTASEEEKKAKIAEAEKKAAMATYEVQKAQFEANQTISIIQAVINTASAIVAQFANPTPYAGAVLAALAAATGAAQIAIISSQKPPPPPKFATGVINIDGPGSETSDSIPALISKGESVLTAKATKRFHRELAQMELAVGNTPNYNFSSGRFATGAIAIPAGDAGFSTNQIQSQVVEQAVQNSILTGLMNMPAPQVSVVEIDRVSASRVKATEIATN